MLNFLVFLGLVLRSFIVSGASGKLQLVTTAVGSIRVSASFVKNNAGTITPDFTNSGAIITATTTDLFAAPGASQQSRVKAFAVYNDHASVSQTITIQSTDGSNVVPLWKGALAPSESLICDANGNFTHNDSGGNPIVGATGRLLQTTVLTSGTTFTTRVDTKSIRVKLLAGGGGGGGCTSVATAASAAGGGGAGGYAEKVFAVTGSTGYTYAIGGAGAGNSAAAGGNGGNTTFAVGATTVTAFGGTGAVVATAVVVGSTPIWYAGGAGGIVSTNGDVNSGGEPGVHGLSNNLTAIGSGNGGSTNYGAGGKGVTASAAGNGAVGFGAGGGGAATGASTARAGGAGGAGMIVVEEYS